MSTRQQEEASLERELLPEERENNLDSSHITNGQQAATVYAPVEVKCENLIKSSTSKTNKYDWFGDHFELSFIHSQVSLEEYVRIIDSIY